MSGSIAVNQHNASAANDPMLDVSLFGTNYQPGALTPEALFAYVSTRLQNLDARVDEVFERQQKADKVRTALRQISAELAGVSGDSKNPADQIAVPDGAEVERAIMKQLDQLGKIDAELSRRVGEELRGVLGTIATDVRGSLERGPGTVSDNALTAAKEHVGAILKDLDASAQLDMIELQSLTSQRQTAVGLATNLLSNLSETLRSVVANIK